MSRHRAPLSDEIFAELVDQRFQMGEVSKNVYLLKYLNLIDFIYFTFYYALVS